MRSGVETPQSVGERSSQFLNSITMWPTDPSRTKDRLNNPIGSERGSNEVTVFQIGRHSNHGHRPSRDILSNDPWGLTFRKNDMAMDHVISRPILVEFSLRSIPPRIRKTLIGQRDLVFGLLTSSQ